MGIEAGWLYGAGGVMTEANYKQLVHRGYLQTLQRPAPGRPAMVAWDGMPDRYRAEVERRIGDPYRAVGRNAVERALTDDAAVWEELRRYRYGEGAGKGLPEGAMREYYADAVVSRAVAAMVAERRSSRKKLGGRADRGVWAEASECVSRLDGSRWPHRLPNNPRRLREKVTEYMAKGVGVFIHKGYGNAVAEKLTDAAKLWVLAEWGNNVRRITSEEDLLRAYNSKAEEAGWPAVRSADTLHAFLYSEGVQPLWYGMRYGELRMKEKFIYQFKTLLPTMRDGLWYSDGTKVNFYYRDADGRPQTMSVYEVVDAYSEVLLGCAFCRTEDYRAQRTAYRMALKAAGEKPYQVEYDNQGGHRRLETSDFMSRLARMAIRTQPYNGKSKTIESIFGRFQRQVLKRLWYFTGQNITATSLESRANLEFILANREKLPTLEEAKAAYMAAREEWNAMAHPRTGVSRIEMYRTSENPGAERLTEEGMRELFCTEEVAGVRVTARGLTFRREGVRRFFIVEGADGMPDVEWLAAHVDSVYTGRFDPDDMRELHLYEGSAERGLRYVVTARRDTEIHRGKQEQEKWEAAFIRAVEGKKKAARVSIRDRMEEALEAHGLLPEQNGLSSPSLKGLETSRGAKATEAVKARTAARARKLGIAEVQKEVSNLVAVGGGEDEIDGALDRLLEACGGADIYSRI